MHEIRAAWLSGMFGFGTDLAYFRQVLAEFGRRFPRGVALVREDYPIHLYPELRLAPLLRFWVKRNDRSVDGFLYTGNLRIPTPRSFFRILRLRLDALIVVEFTPTAIAGIVSSRLVRRPVVLLIESQPRFRRGADGRFARLIKGVLARMSEVVLVSNEGTAQYVKAALGVPPERVMVGPYLTSQPEATAVSFSSSGPVRFLFLNSLQERKGLHLLVEALANVGPTQRPWVLDVVGDGPQRNEISDLVHRLGLTDHVAFHGRVRHDQVGVHYAKAHVVVCPTQGDYRSLAGFEAVNAGRVVVLSNRDGATEEILASGAAATAVDPVRVDELAAVLRRFLGADDYLAEQLRRAAVPPTQFSVESVGANLAAAIERAAAARR